MSIQFAHHVQRRACSTNVQRGVQSPDVRRSDVQRLAQSAPTINPVYSLRDLTVESRDDAILISGSVTSFYHKQLVQEAVCAVAGRMNVVNAVHVETR